VRSCPSSPEVDVPARVGISTHSGRLGAERRAQAPSRSRAGEPCQHRAVAADRARGRPLPKLRVTSNELDHASTTSLTVSRWTTAMPSTTSSLTSRTATHAVPSTQRVAAEGGVHGGTSPRLPARSGRSVARCEQTAPLDRRRASHSHRSGAEVPRVVGRHARISRRHNHATERHRSDSRDGHIAACPRRPTIRALSDRIVRIHQTSR
jgi:hypothetical protein